MTAYALQLPKFQAFDANGLPLSGGKVYTYETGTTTNKTTYTDSGAGTPNANPVILNSRGEADIWLDGTYTVVLKDSNDVQIYSVDNVTGIGSTSDVIDQWVLSGLTPTYVSATSFTLAGDQTDEFEVGRRIKTTNSGGTVYSTIITSAYTTLTTVTTVNDASASLDSGLSSVSLGILSTTSQAFPYKERMLKLATTHNITSDASYTLTATQNIYGRIIITDTGPLLTGAVNIVVNTDERDFIAQNDTLQTLTFKTASGSGIAVNAGDVLYLACDGTNVVKAFSNSDYLTSSITEGTSQATTSGTTVSFTGIPSGTKKILIQLVGVTCSGAITLVIGDSGGYETSGYTGGCAGVDASPVVTGSLGSSLPIAANADTSHGIVTLSREKASSNTWALSGNLFGTANILHVSAGSKSLSAELDRLQLGGGTFSAGEANISYES